MNKSNLIILPATKIHLISIFFFSILWTEECRLPFVRDKAAPLLILQGDLYDHICKSKPTMLQILL